MWVEADTGTDRAGAGDKRKSSQVAGATLGM